MWSSPLTIDVDEERNRSVEKDSSNHQIGVIGTPIPSTKKGLARESSMDSLFSNGLGSNEQVSPSGLSYDQGPSSNASSLFSNDGNSLLWSESKDDTDEVTNCLDLLSLLSPKETNSKTPIKPIDRGIYSTQDHCNQLISSLTWAPNSIAPQEKVSSELRPHPTEVITMKESLYHSHYHSPNPLPPPSSHHLTYEPSLRHYSPSKLSTSTISNLNVVNTLMNSGRSLSPRTKKCMEFANEYGETIPRKNIWSSSKGSSRDKVRVKHEEAIDGYMYLVRFKRAHKTFVLSPSAPRNIEPGMFVKVEADRGEDLGVVLAKIAVEEYEEEIPTAGYRGRGFSSGASDRKFILREASYSEKSQIPQKVEEEERVLEMIRQKTAQRKLPMIILDAEFQFDRHKLTYFFEADSRIDFRDLVSELFSLYKTRIWMQQVDTTTIPRPEDPEVKLAFASGLLPPTSQLSVVRTYTGVLKSQDTYDDVFENRSEPYLHNNNYSNSISNMSNTNTIIPMNSNSITGNFRSQIYPIPNPVYSRRESSNVLTYDGSWDIPRLYNK